MKSFGETIFEARMEQGWIPDLGKSVLIGHADDPEDCNRNGKHTEMQIFAEQIDMIDLDTAQTDSDSGCCNLSEQLDPCI